MISRGGIGGNRDAKGPERDRSLAEGVLGLRDDDATMASVLEFARDLLALGDEEIATKALSSVAANASCASLRKEACGLLVERSGRKSGATESAPRKPLPEIAVKVMSIRAVRKALRGNEMATGGRAVVVSTSDPRENGFPDEGFFDTLLLRYDDVTDPARAGAFAKTDAESFAEFALRMVGSASGRSLVEEIVFACDGGASRSAALACSLLLFLTGSDDGISSDGSYSPNPLVKKLALEALEEGQGSYGSPLVSKLARYLKELERERRESRGLENQEFRIAVERDLLRLRDLDRNVRKIRTGTPFDSLLPAGGFYEGMLYRLSGDGANDLAAFLRRSLARQGMKVLSLERAPHAVASGDASVRRMGIHVLAANGPDGQPLIDFLLDSESEPFDAIFLDDVETALSAYYSRYPKSVRDEELDEPLFPEMLRYYGAAVIAVDNFTPPPEGAPYEKKAPFVHRTQTLRAFEDVKAVLAGENTLAVSRSVRCHTSSCVDSNPAEIVMSLDRF